MPWTIVNEEEKIRFDYGDNNGERIISYAQAINEALDQALELDERVYLMGQGINDKIGFFGATNGLADKYGESRVFDTPLSEAGLTGIAVGSALAGMRPFYCHNRPDFLMLAMDQIINHASKYSYMSGGQCSVPMVLWAVTGKGWGSAAQHSQALQGLFMHIPGLKIVMPTTPYDVKGMIASAIADNNPIMFLEHRALFNQEGTVPKELYKIPLGKGVIRREGTDVSVIAISEMVPYSLKAAEQLEKEGISCEVIDLRTIKPYDKELIIKSVSKTKRVLIADTGWFTGGVSAEISRFIYDNLYMQLKHKIQYVCLPDCPTPASYSLEDAFYRDERDIIYSINEMFKE